MFGSRSGSPYGAFGLLTAPNTSAGSGGGLNASQNAPLPSGGAPNAGIFSVYNKGIDNEVNTTPSCFVIPSTHIDLNDDDNRMSTGDFVFVLRTTDNIKDKYETKQSRQGANETSLVTLPKLNRMLREYAVHNQPAAIPRGPVDHQNLSWFQRPDVVAEWAVPFGVVLNSMPLNKWHSGGDSGNRSTNQRGVGHNIAVSRRVNCKHNFFSVCGTKSGPRGCQSMQHLAVQYSLEFAKLLDQTADVPIVQVSMMLVDDYSVVQGHERLEDIGGGNIQYTDEWKTACRKGDGTAHTTEDTGDPDIEVQAAVSIDASQPDHPVLSESSYEIFERAPLGDPSTRFIVPIGRVLHSPASCPSATDCLLANHKKSKYDTLSGIEIELGCP